MSNNKQKTKKQGGSQQKQPGTGTAAWFSIPAYVYLIGLAVCILFSIYIRSNFIDIPFERDEGSYTYCGKIILDGAIPFKDIGSQRLPGVFYVYAFMVWLFGYSLESMHIGFMFVNVLTIIVLWYLAKLVFDNFTALITAASFVLISMIPDVYGFTTQSEHLVALFGFTGILCLVLWFRNEKWYWLVLSGVLLSIAFQVKQTSVFYAGFCGILFLYHYFKVRPVKWKEMILKGLIFFGSFLVPVLFSLFVIWKQGAWADFHIWFFDVSKTYTSVISFSDGLDLLGSELVLIGQGYSLLWYLSLLGIGLTIYLKMDTFKKLFMIGLYIFCFITVMPGNHYYGHYFLQFTPAVALSVGVCIYGIMRVLKEKAKLWRSAGIIATLVFVFAAGNNISKMSEYYFNPNFFKVLRAVYGINPFPESKVIADKLNTVLKPEDKIVILGTEVEVYVYTNKLSVSRFAGSGALVEFPVAQYKDWQREFIRDVENAMPRFLIFYGNRYSWMQHPKAENLIEPWFNTFANQHYDLYGYADMYSNITRWAWTPNIDMVNDPPKSDFKVYIFEKRKVPVQPIPAPAPAQ